MAKSSKGDSGRKLATRLAHLGRDKSLTGPFVNPPVIHASTVLFDTVDDMIHRRQRYVYGRRGTPTSDALEMAVRELEDAAGAVLCPSGLAAVSTALLSSLSAGDHLLMADCAYAPARIFVSTVLKRLGVETTFFDPALGSEIDALFNERTRAVYLESPGWMTFEMQDIPAIAAVAHARGALVICDNTWATPLFCRPLDLGADLSLQAGTKYLGGHSDVMLGVVAANERAWPQLKETHGHMGTHVGPDDIFLGLRGLRTLGVRLDRHMQSTATVTDWLAGRKEVSRVLYPARPDDPGHAIWRRDMSGATGLFGLVLRDLNEQQAKAFIDGLELFGIGASWGGFESLAALARPETLRRTTPWHAEGPLIRLHIGLEDPGDLIADLEASLDRVAAGA
ncbi:MAG: cystathionine beta-lyase [Bauldia sp.]